MSLADDLKALENARRNTGGTPCRASMILDSMSAEDRAELARLIDATPVYASQIARLLQEHGHRISAGQISHHRRRMKGGGCTCPRPDEAS